MLNIINAQLLKLNKILIKNFKLKITRESADNDSILYNSPDELKNLFLKQKIRKNDLFLIPVEICLWGYGFRYLESEHPFIAFLKNDLNLFTWYENFTPNTIAEAYFLDEIDNTKVRHNVSTSGVFDDVGYKELPPFIRGRVETGNKESPLGHSDGIQFHGPVSRRKVEWEISRLNTTYMSIKKYGYRPDSLKFDGHIFGQFIKIDKEFRFQVLSGRHRAACLAALGIKHLPVKIYPDGGGGIVPLVSKDFIVNETLLSITDSITSLNSISKRERLINISKN
jgi:hypothetical protein